MPFTANHPEGLTFKVYIQPRSSANRIEGCRGDALKVRIKAAPVGGAANKMCIAFLAKTLGVSKSSLEILTGHASRDKRLLLRCADGSAANAARQQMRSQIESLFDRQKTT